MYFLNKAFRVRAGFCIFPLRIKGIYLAHYVRHWGVLMFGDENAPRWNIHFFFSWLNYVCVHCQVENSCSSEGCFKRTFLPLAQNTLPSYYREGLAHIHMQPYGNIKWRRCTPQWTRWISMSISCPWLILCRLCWLLLLTHIQHRFSEGLPFTKVRVYLSPLISYWKWLWGLWDVISLSPQSECHSLGVLKSHTPTPSPCHTPAWQAGGIFSREHIRESSATL